MRAVFWEVEVDSTERLRPPQAGDHNEHSAGGGRKGRCSIQSSCQTPAASESPGAHQLLGVRADGRAADRTLETSMQPGSVLRCGPLHCSAHPDPLDVFPSYLAHLLPHWYTLPLLGPDPNTFLHAYLESFYPLSLPTAISLCC